MKAFAPEEKSKTFLYIFMAFFIGISLALIIYNSISYSWLKKDYYVSDFPNAELATPELHNGDFVEQVFSTKTFISGINIRFLFLNNLSSGVLTATLYDNERDVVLGTVSREMTDFGNDENFYLQFPEPCHSAAPLRLVLSVSRLDPHSQFVIRLTNTPSISNLPVAVLKGTHGAGSLAFSLKGSYIFLSFYYMFFCGFIILFICFLICFRFIPLHYFFSILMIGSGFVLLCIVTPLYGFDMLYHADSAYNLSNRILGKGTAFSSSQTPEGLVLTSRDSTELYYLRRDGDDFRSLPMVNDGAGFVRTYYANQYEAGWVATDSEIYEGTGQEASTGFSNIASYLYLPQAIGFSVARLLHLNRYGLLFFGRLCLLLCYTTITCVAIRAAPFGKLILFLVALSPISSFSAVSLSRDSLIIALCLFVIGKALAFLSSPSIDWFSFVPFLIVSFLLIFAKFIYFPLALLWVYVLWQKRSSLENSINKKKIFYFLIIVGVFLFLLCFFFLGGPSIFNFFKNHAETSINAQLSFPDTSGHSLKEILWHPFRTVGMLFLTSFEERGNFFFNIIAPLELPCNFSYGVALGWIACLSIAILKPTSSRLSITDCMVLLTIFTTVFLAVCFAATSWTPLGSASISGLQGRYLTPVFALFLLAFSSLNFIKTTFYSSRLIKIIVIALCFLTPLDIFLWTLS